MDQRLTVQELVFLIATKQQNPTILNPDFLIYSGIVPEDWKLARPPIYTNQVAQITYQNGVNIVAQSNRIIFSEMLEGKALSDIVVPQVVQKYVEMLPKVDYQAIGTNFRGYVGCTSDEAYQYVCHQLLSSGPWQEFGQEPMRAAINYFYALEQGRLNISVNEASLQYPDQDPFPVILFSGNVNYDHLGEVKEERLKSLSGIIARWQQDLETFTTLVNTRFLKQAFIPVAASSELLVMSGNA